MPVRSKLTGVQCLRAVAVLLVVLFHLQLFEQKLPGPMIAPDQFVYGMAGVDLFFVISGFIITTISLGQFGRPGCTWRFLRHRFTRIYPTYWVYYLGLTAVYLAAPNMVNHSHGKPDLLLSALLLPQGGTPLLFVSWSLSYELFFYLVFAVLLRWLHVSQLPYVLAGWTALVVAGNLTLDTGQPILGLMFSPLILEFILGCTVALFFARLGRRAAWSSLTLGIAGFVLGSALLDLAGIPFGWWSRTIVYGPVAALLVAGTVGVEHAGWRFPRPLIRLGDASYSMYLSHILVLGAVAQIAARRFATPSPGSHLAVMAIELVAVTAWALLSFRWIELPLLAALRGRSAATLRSQPVPAAP